MDLILKHDGKWLLFFLGYSIRWFVNNYKCVVDEGNQTGFRVQSQGDDVGFRRNIKREALKKNLITQESHSELLKCMNVYVDPSKFICHLYAYNECCSLLQ